MIYSHNALGTSIYGAFLPREDVTITPSALSVTATVEIPSLTWSSSVIPDVLAISLTLSGITVLVVENIIITPSTLAISVSIPAPVITIPGDIVVTPSVLPITASTLTPVITIGITIIPSTLPITASVSSPVVIIDLQVSPSVLPIVASVLSVFIDDPLVLPSVLTISVSLPMPTILVVGIAVNRHSLWSDERTCLFVDNGVLKRLFPDYSTSDLRSNVGSHPMSYAYAPNSPDKTEDTIYYANANVIGYINAQGVSNTFSDPGIAFRTAPEPAQHIEYYHTRLYFGDNQTIWYSDALGLGRINKRLNNIPLSDEITMMEAVDDGIWVSTGDKYGRIFFLAGNTPQEFTEITKADYGIIQGSAVKIRDASTIFHGIGLTGTAIVFATKHGICLCGNGGRFINLTYDKYKLTDNRFGAGLLRINDNKAFYIATTWN